MLNIVTPINHKMRQLVSLDRPRTIIATSSILALLVALAGVFLFLMPAHAASNLAPGTDPSNFVTTWNTNANNDGSTSITIPTFPGETYNYDVDWDNDGIFDETGITGDATHDFGVAGTYTVRVRGEFPRIYFGSDTAVDSRAKILSIDQWGTGSWRSMASAFLLASNLTSSALDAPNLTDVEEMSYMFWGAKAFNSDLSTWNTSNVTNMSGMFTGAFAFNGDISTWNTSNVTNMSGMFSGNSLSTFNGDLSTWNTGKVTDMSGMFANVRTFNSDLSTWNTSNVTNMSGMFTGAVAFNSDLSTWNTSNVTNMSSMFSSANTFNSNLSNWDTSNVTNMSDMFSGSTAFNGDISSWDTGKVTTMSRMFSDASTFSADLSNWNTGSVTNMGYMFVNARAFDSNLGSWDLRALTDLSYMLSRSGLSETHYDATLVGWAAQLVPTGLTLNAADLQYCAAQAARQQLIDVSHWVIAGDRSCDDVVVEKKITGVSFTTGANSELILKITGDSLVDSDSFEHIDALSRSLVSLNSTPLKTCAFGGMTASEITAAFSGVYPNVGANVTDDQPCYYIVASDGNTAAITMTQALIWLPPTFDTTAQGTVSVNGSPVYTFNQQTTPGVDEPTAIVENKPLTGVPVIPKRPHFSGTAEPGATVTVTVHSDPISCTALADSNGNWSCQLPSDLEPGQHTVNIHVVLPGGGTQDLGPYTVTVNPDGTSTPITNTTLLAPNTGFAQTVKTLTTQPQGLILLATLLAALGVGGMVVRERRRS